MIPKQPNPDESALPEKEDYEPLVGLVAGMVAGSLVGMFVACVMATFPPAIATLGWVPVTLSVIAGGIIGWRSPDVAKGGWAIAEIFFWWF